MGKPGKAKTSHSTYREFSMAATNFSRIPG